MTLDVALLRSSFDEVVARGPHLTTRFYEILFERYPQVKPLFGRNAPDAQAKMLTEALVAVVDHLEDAPWLQTQLGALGARHVDYGVTEPMYGWVGECLLAAMSEIAADAWSPQIEAAWAAAYGAIVGLVLAGGARSSAAH